MRPLANDTDLATEGIYLALWRARTPQQKLQALAETTAALRTVVAGRLYTDTSAAVATVTNMRAYLARRLYAWEVADQVGEEKEAGAAMAPNPIAVTLLVADYLDQLAIPYLIGGSLASSVYGVPRATMDTDLLIALSRDQASALVRKLSDAFYVSHEAAMDAVRRRSSFNAIHLASMWKVDLFVSRGRPYDRAQLARREPQVVATEPRRTLFFATAEDTILTKLEWFRLGNEVSDRQWADILSVMKLRGAHLDHAYLLRWAATLDLADLLERARQDAGPLWSADDGQPT